MNTSMEIELARSQTPPSLQCSPSLPLECFSDEDFVEPLRIQKLPFASSVSQQTPEWAFTAGLLGLISIMTTIAFLLEPPGYEIKVAFAGNSMQYVNDLPRFMQALAGRKRMGPNAPHLIHQNSCLHGTVNLKTQFKYGNGVGLKWNTKKGELPGYDPNDGIFDFGTCTVEQLVLGYDEKLYDYANYYTQDGKNPCFIYSGYYNYTMKHYQGNPVDWDYIVINDNTKWPAIEEKKETSLGVLENTWVPWLTQVGATPILYATHGYITEVVNVTGLGTVSEFTSNVFEGYRQYAELLSANLPDEQQPRIAPVGLAFLVVYEENHDLWRKLFYVDGLHPSPSGSFLMGCVLYATLYGHMPRRSIALPVKISSLWKRARKMAIDPRYYMPYPSQREAEYLFGVARRVMMQGYRPESWTKYYDEDTDNDFIGKWN